MRGPLSCAVGCVSRILFWTIRERRQRSPEAESLDFPLSCDPNRRRYRTPVRNSAVTLQLCVPHLLRMRWFDRIRRKQLCHCAPRCGRHVGDQCRRNDAILARDLRKNDWWCAGIENDALRPFPIGVNAGSGRAVLRACGDLRCRKIRVGHEQQRKQPCADEEKVPCQGHLGSFIPARI